MGVRPRAYGCFRDTDYDAMTSRWMTTEIFTMTR